MRACGLPRGPFDRLIAANRRDQVQATYATFDELADYCTLSANPVGELVLYVFDAATPERIALSDRVCTALQLVEHWQDVGRGLRARPHLPARRGPRALRRRARRPRRGGDERGAARADGVRGRRARTSCSTRARRSSARCAAARGSRSPATSAAGARTLDAIARAGYDVLAGPPKASSAERVARDAPHLEARPVTATAAPAFEHVRRVARESGSSFYAGMRLLPADKRDALFAIYALARRIDDIADGDAPAGREARRGSRGTRDELDRIDESDDPVLVAVADAARRYPIPLAAFGELVDGAEMDVRGTEYATFAELEHYCRCVAGSIGRLALGVFDCSDRAAAEPLADDLGLALQVGNILRDLAEDVPNGRVYLPREDLDRFGCDVAAGASRAPSSCVDRVRGAARARTARPRAGARAAARPPQRVVRARDDGQVRPAARADRRRPADRHARPASLRRWEKGSCSRRASIGSAA